MQNLVCKAANRLDAARNGRGGLCDPAKENRFQNRRRTAPLLRQRIKAHLMPRWGRPTVQPCAKAEFYQRLAQTLEIGLPILSALEENSRCLSSRPMRRLSAELKQSLGNGRALHEAMDAHPHIFPKWEVHVVRLGEEKGVLPVCLKQLTVYLHWNEDLRARICKAVVYPCYVIFAILAVMGIWIGYALPQIVAMLGEMGVPVPRATAMVIGFGEWFKSSGLWLTLAAGIAALAAYLYQRTEKGGIRFDWALLQLPLLGPVLRNIALTRLGHHLAILSTVGTNFQTAFHLLAGSGLGNRFLVSRLHLALQTAQATAPMATAIEAAGGCPATLLRYIRSAEIPGTLDPSFLRFGEQFDGEVQRTVQRLVRAFEPITILLLGAVFGMIAVSVLLPLYDIVGALPKAC